MTAQTAWVQDISFSSLLGLLWSYDARLNRHMELWGVATANTVQSSSTVVCQIYDKRGHAAWACFNSHNEQWFPSTQDKVKSRYRFNRGGKTNTSTANTVWYPDSGVSDHVTNSSDCIQTTDSKDSTHTLTVANGNPILVQLSGSSFFSIQNKSVRLNDILLVWKYYNSL